MGKAIVEAIKRVIKFIFVVIKALADIGIALVKNLMIPLFKMVLGMINGIIQMLIGMIKNLTDTMKDTVENIIPDESDKKKKVEMPLGEAVSDKKEKEVENG